MYRLRNFFRNQMMQVILIQLITGADKQGFLPFFSEAWGLFVEGVTGFFCYVCLSEESLTSSLNSTFGK